MPLPRIVGRQPKKPWPFFQSRTYWLSPTALRLPARSGVAPAPLSTWTAERRLGLERLLGATRQAIPTAELHALHEALGVIQLIAEEAPTPRNILVCTDSQSALSRLKEGPASQTERLPDQIWTHLREIGQRHRVDLQWVPGHAGVAGNEEADKIAGEAAAMDQDSVPITLAAAKCQLKRHLGKEWVESTRQLNIPSTGPRLSLDYNDTVGPGRVRPPDKLGLSRREGVALARIRTGHSPALKAYREWIQLEADPHCEACGGVDREDAKHLLTSCPASALLRHEMFGREDPTLKEVFADPVGVVTYLRRLGRL